VLDAVLSDFLLTGATEANNIVAYSGFTTIDFGGAPRLSRPFDELTFATPLSTVSFDAGSGLSVGSMLDVRAFNMSGGLLGSTSVALMPEFQRVSLSGMGITRLVYGVDDEFAEFAIDNLNTAPGLALVGAWYGVTKGYSAELFWYVWGSCTAGVLYGAYATWFGMRELARLAWRWNSPLRTLDRG
jgi:hypothetical protein